MRCLKLYFNTKTLWLARVTLWRSIFCANTLLLMVATHCFHVILSYCCLSLYVLKIASYWAEEMREMWQIILHISFTTFFTIFLLLLKLWTKQNSSTKNQLKIIKGNIINEKLVCLTGPLVENCNDTYLF